MDTRTSPDRLRITQLREVLTRAGVDGQVLGLAVAGALQSALAAADVTLRTQGDLLDEIWPDRPGLPTPPVYEHSAPHATQSRAEKLAAVRKALVAEDATHHFVSTVDDIAWLTNLRGSDVSYCSRQRRRSADLHPESSNNWNNSAACPRPSSAP